MCTKLIKSPTVLKLWMLVSGNTILYLYSISFIVSYMVRESQPRSASKSVSGVIFDAPVLAISVFCMMFWMAWRCLSSYCAFGNRILPKVFCVGICLQ